MSDLICRDVVIDVANALYKTTGNEGYAKIVRQLKDLPSAEQEVLTDKEQRIFLSAMSREKIVCTEVDANHTREAYEDTLMFVCNEIIRKVKGALWT